MDEADTSAGLAQRHLINYTWHHLEVEIITELAADMDLWICNRNNSLLNQWKSAASTGCSLDYWRNMCIHWLCANHPGTYIHVSVKQIDLAVFPRSGQLYLPQSTTLHLNNNLGAFLWAVPFNNFCNRMVWVFLERPSTTVSVIGATWSYLIPFAFHWELIISGYGSIELLVLGRYQFWKETWEEQFKLQIWFKYYRLELGYD